jgi:hypothetical protein
MKKINKTLSIVAASLMGGGLLTSVPFIATSCGNEVQDHYQIRSDKSSLKFGSDDQETILSLYDNDTQVSGAVYILDNTNYCEIESGSNVLKLRNVNSPAEKITVDITANVNGAKVKADKSIDI